MRNVEHIPRPLRLAFKAVSSENVRAQLHDLDYHIGQAIDTYTHHLSLCPSSVNVRLRTILKTTRLLTQRQRVLCYPDLPGPGSVFYKLCLHRGFAITNDPSASFDAAIKWRDATYTSTDPILQDIASSTRVVNLNLTDISKGYVGEIFQKVFGYNLAVNPRTFDGPILRKSEENAAHDGTVLEGPVRHPSPDKYAYQRLVNNIEDNLAVDLRVPIFDRQIPFVRVKFRPVEKRFDHAGQSQVADSVQPPGHVLSSRERQRILEMCERMGLEYGELDVVRDRDTERIFVVDVNDTPTGPTFTSASRTTVEWCFTRMAEAMHTCLFESEERRPSPQPTETKVRQMVG